MPLLRLLDAACLAVVLSGWAIGGCTKYLVDKPPAVPFDAVIVPGCPSENDGSPSYCQLGRAGQAALLWRDGWTRNFIVSGSDVHSPYVEAEALAQVMTLLGVPPSRIVLERDALHSDENVYYSLAIARELGFEHLAIATNGPVASGLCSMMVQWGHECSGIAMDVDALERFMPPYDARLHALRARRVEDWEPLEPREARIARFNGYTRPASFWMYVLYPWLGPSHRPIEPGHQPITWEKRLRDLSGQ